MFKFNAITYTMLTGMLMCSCTGLIFTNIFNATLNCLTLASVVQVVAVALAGSFQFNSNGKTCMAVTAVYNERGNSWESDGILMRQLFIAQCSLILPFFMCACFGMKKGRSAGPVKHDDDYVRDY